MDFDVPQQNGVTFMYLLPYSPTTALIEYTVFSEQTLPPEQYEDEIENYIGRLLSKSGNPDSGYQFLRKEKGEIPLSPGRPSPWYCKQAYTRGFPAGHPSPGPAHNFSRLQNQ